MARLTPRARPRDADPVAGNKTLTYRTGEVRQHFRYFTALARRRAGASLVGEVNLPRIMRTNDGARPE